MILYPTVKMAPFMSGTSTTGGAGGFGNARGGGLYEFTTYTFEETVAGRNGPSFSTLQSRYAGEGFLTSGSLVQGLHQGYHRLTLPYTGRYFFEAAGAAGTSPSYDTGLDRRGGRGAIVQGQMDFEMGDEIQFTIGRAGEPETYNGGGGGGTFVVKQAFCDTSSVDSNIVLIAGGGAGGSYNVTSSDLSIRDASPTITASQPSGGTARGDRGINGNGGNGNGYSGGSGAAAPAGGLYTAGTNFTYSSNATICQGWLQGAQGGEGYYTGGASGGHDSGFGCAGGGGNHAGGPGGGYNGGGGGGGNGFSSSGGSSHRTNLINGQGNGWREPDALDKDGNSGYTRLNPIGGYLTITFVG